VNRRLGHGLQFRGAYTFSKTLDDGDNMNTSVATNSPAFVVPTRFNRRPIMAELHSMYGRLRSSMPLMIFRSDAATHLTGAPGCNS
jgi:hypothetical protein